MNSLKKLILLILISAVITISGCSTCSKSCKTESLFNGRDLTGWKILGGEGNFYVENNQIIGLTQKGVENSFLATEENYSDFLLELDFKVDPALNSGVQIRSDVHKKDVTCQYLSGSLEESSRTFKAGTVYGYQVEIDPSDRAWTGGLYEEGGRGWLKPPKNNPASKKAFKQNQFNHLKIMAEGSKFITWLNGVKVIETTDNKRSTGFIALQLHKVYNPKQENKKVHFKNIRIKEY